MAHDWRQSDRHGGGAYRNELYVMLDADDVENVRYIAAETMAKGKLLLTTNDVIRHALAALAIRMAGEVSYDLTEGGK